MCQCGGHPLLAALEPRGLPALREQVGCGACSPTACPHHCPCSPAAAASHTGALPVFCSRRPRRTRPGGARAACRYCLSVMSVFPRPQACWHCPQRGSALETVAVAKDSLGAWSPGLRRSRRLRGHPRCGHRLAGWAGRTELASAPPVAPGFVPSEKRPPSGHVAATEWGLSPGLLYPIS